MKILFKSIKKSKKFNKIKKIKIKFRKKKMNNNR